MGGIPIRSLALLAAVPGSPAPAAPLEPSARLGHSFAPVANGKEAEDLKKPIRSTLLHERHNAQLVHFEVVQIARRSLNRTEKE